MVQWHVSSFCGSAVGLKWTRGHRDELFIGARVPGGAGCILNGFRNGIPFPVRVSGRNF
jgi:hypothetical protein